MFPHVPWHTKVVKSYILIKQLFDPVQPLHLELCHGLSLYDADIYHIYNGTENKVWKHSVVINCAGTLTVAQITPLLLHMRTKSLLYKIFGRERSYTWLALHQHPSRACLSWSIELDWQKPPGNWGKHRPRLFSTSHRSVLMAVHVYAQPYVLFVVLPRVLKPFKHGCNKHGWHSELPCAHCHLIFLRLYGKRAAERAQRGKSFSSGRYNHHLLFIEA